jgi:hypothetical protein
MNLKLTDYGKTFDVSCITEDILSGEIDPYDLLDSETDADNVMDAVKTLQKFVEILDEHDNLFLDEEDDDDWFDEDEF